MREPGAKTARIHYNARGWTVHTIHNVWGFTSPGQVPHWGLFPMAGPWLSQHLWEHYAFSRDAEFLKRRLADDAIVRGVLPRLARRRSAHEKARLRPGESPENTFVAPDGSKCSISMGPSMDQQIIFDLFTNVLDAATALGIDDGDDTVKRVRAARERLLGRRSDPTAD
jgi:alpha-L-fucosidase 2